MPPRALERAHVQAGVAPDVRARAEEEHRRREVEQAARDHEAVAAVVALAAEDERPARARDSARARRAATAAPAFSMSTAPGRPISSMVRRSASRICAAVRTGPHLGDCYPTRAWRTKYTTTSMAAKAQR